MRLLLRCRESHAEASYRRFVTFCESHGITAPEICAYDAAAPIQQLAPLSNGEILECSLPACLWHLENTSCLKIVAHLDMAASSCSIYYPKRRRFDSFYRIVPSSLSTTNICAGHFLRQLGCHSEWIPVSGFPNIIKTFSDHAKDGDSDKFVCVLDDTQAADRWHRRLVEELLPLTLDGLGVERADLFRSAFQREVWVPGMILLAEERLLWNPAMARAVLDFLDAWEVFAAEDPESIVPSKRIGWYAWHDTQAMLNLQDVSRSLVQMADPELKIRRPIQLEDFSIRSMLVDRVHGSKALANLSLAAQKEVWSTATNLRPAA